RLADALLAKQQARAEPVRRNHARELISFRLAALPHITFGFTERIEAPQGRYRSRVGRDRHDRTIHKDAAALTGRVVYARRMGRMLPWLVCALALGVSDVAAGGAQTTITVWATPTPTVSAYGGVSYG